MSTVPDTAALRLAGVTKRWRGRAEPVLDAVDLELAPGSLTWLGGGNGAGKTTLLRIACGMLAPTAGRVSVGGADLEDRPRACKRRLGFLSAGSSGLYARLTARQQLDLWARLSFVEPAARRATIEGAVERYGLAHLADRRLDRISMGERQRVRLAMAFAHRPAVALLDEPRNSLDSEGLALLVDVVGEHRAAGGATLWCSPTGERPATDCDAELLLRDGALRPA